MATGEGNREDQSQDDLQVVEDQEVDPLAILAAELAICIIYVEESKGAFCDDCTCVLQFHCTTDSGECELCLCYGHYNKIPPVFIPSAKMPDAADRHITDNKEVVTEEQDRQQAARRALRELTD